MSLEYICISLICSNWKYNLLLYEILEFSVHEYIFTKPGPGREIHISSVSLVYLFVFKALNSSQDI